MTKFFDSYAIAGRERKPLPIMKPGRKSQGQYFQEDYPHAKDEPCPACNWNPCRCPKKEVQDETAVENRR